ncbi:MAG: ABC transporter permease subunit [Eubacteriales bacterium]|nr:ABC transporter permease subunit [Eubacteriales bacterium]
MNGSSMQRTWRRVCRSWQLYVFLILPVAYILIFCYYPMAGLQIAFKKYNMSKGIWGSPWIGLKNFERFFASYQFKRIIGNTLVLSFYSLLASFPLPIALALGLNAMRGERYRKFIQNVVYLPHFISTIVLIGILYQMMNPRTGVYGLAYSALHDGAYAPNIVGQANSFRHFYVWSGVWQSMGWSSVIYIAALSGVDKALHEAAQIDGASRLQRLWHVDVPHLLPTVSIMLILRMGSIMSVGFEKVYLMQNNLNLPTSEVISTYVYKVAMASGTSDFSYSTAIGMFNSLVNLLLMIVVNAISRRLGEGGLW